MYLILLLNLKNKTALNNTSEFFSKKKKKEIKIYVTVLICYWQFYNVM